MSTPTTIRLATPSDVAALTTLLAELNRAEGYDSSIEPSALAEVLFGADARIQMQALVAERGGQAVGLVLVYWGFDTVSASYGYHLADIIVTKRARGKTIGKQLMQALAAHCLNENGQWISLTVLERNSAAQKFYASLKMTKVDVDFFAIGPQMLRRLVS